MFITIVISAWTSSSVRHSSQVSVSLYIMPHFLVALSVDRSDDIKRKERTARRLVWRYDDIDADNAPFTIDNNVILCCQYGNPHKRDCIAEVKYYLIVFKFSDLI